MLNITTQALNPQQLKERLAVKYQELDVIRENFANVATHASLIAGFSFNALVKENFSNDVPLHVKGLFSIFTVMGIVLLLHSVFISTLCIVCGPNLAMRGKDPEKSVDQAVKGMVAARRNVYGSFVAGIVVFQFSVMLWIVARLGYFHGGRGGVGWATLCGLLIVVVMGITCVAAYYLYSMYFKLSLYSVDSEWMAFKQQANLHPDLNEDRIGEPSHESSSLLKGRFTCQKCRQPVSSSDRVCSNCGFNLLGY